jgi:hypothetical protein
MSLLNEIRSELRQLLSGRPGVADAVVPPLIFVGVNSFAGVDTAVVAGLVSAGAIIGWRLLRGRSLRFAVAGLGGTLIAAAFAFRTGRATAYFLPGIVTGAATTLIIAASIFAGRPFVAYVSSLTRGWPLDWYWHPRVKPAYTRVSWLWLAFFAARTVGHTWLYLADQVLALGLIRVVTGWPALLALLVVTYVLGRRWLEALQGPSVEEFLAGADPPWRGQERGF